MSRRKMSRGKLLPPRLTGMSREATEIAVSEISNVSRDRLCGFVILVVSHPEDKPGSHNVDIVFPPEAGSQWAVRWLEAAARDVRENS